MSKLFFRRLKRSSQPLILARTVELGSAWAGNTVNCVPFRTNAVSTHGSSRYATYYDDAGDVIVSRHDLATNLVHSQRIANERKPYDAHQAISTAFDAQGRFHLAFGAHNSSILTTRSRSKDLSTGFKALEERHERATYPMFLELQNGELALLLRRGRHFEGEIFVERYDLDRSVWLTDETPLFSGIGERWPCGPYLNTPAIAANGSVHLFVVWRLRSDATSAGAVVNAGLDAFVSYDGLRHLHTHNGVRLSTPVTPVNTERVIAVPLGSGLINQASAALLPKDRPAVLTYWDDGEGIIQYKLGWQAQSIWRVATVSKFTTRFRPDGGGTLPLPHSRPELVAHDDGRLIILYRSSEAGNRLLATELDPPDYDISRARHQVLVDEDLGFYEPVIDRSAWRNRRELVLYVQRCEQGMGRDGKRDLAAAPAKLMIWEPA